MCYLCAAAVIYVLSMCCRCYLCVIYVLPLLSMCCRYYLCYLCLQYELRKLTVIYVLPLLSVLSMCCHCYLCAAAIIYVLSMCCCCYLCYLCAAAVICVIYVLLMLSMCYLCAAAVFWAAPPDIALTNTHHAHLGLARTVYLRCVPYTLYNPCKQYCICTVCIWFWPTLYAPYMTVF
jgi:hypothetical protein